MGNAKTVNLLFTLTAFCRTRSNFSHFSLAISFLNISICLEKDSKKKRQTKENTKYVLAYWSYSIHFSRKTSIKGNDKELEHVVPTHRTSYRSVWPRGFDALDPNPQFWIFTSVSLGSSPRSYSFTSAKIGISVHTATKSDKNLSTFRSARCSFAPRSTLLFANRSPVWSTFRAGAKVIRCRVNIALLKGAVSRNSPKLGN